ncbi:hypothetical protein OHA73_35715 [Streptomyces sp. NBC_00483]
MSPGVFISNPSSRTRHSLWDKVRQCADQGALPRPHHQQRRAVWALGHSYRFR